MLEVSGYHLLLAIKEALKSGNIPNTFWNSFEICVSNQDCLQRTANRFVHDLHMNKKFRVVMNNAFTIHMVFSEVNNKVVVSLEGIDAQKYEGVEDYIQSAVDQFFSQT